MKRIYATAALLFALFSGSYAQQVDLWALPIIDSMVGVPATGQGLSFYSLRTGTAPTNDSLAAGCFYGIGGRGVGLTAGNQIAFADPTSDISSAGLSFWVTSPFTQDIDTGNLITYDRSLLASDSISSLLNIQNYLADSLTYASLMVPRASLVTGQVYGFYAHVRPYPFSGADYSDTMRDDNFLYVPIKWNVTTGIKDLLNPQYASMDVYPNPAVQSVAFEIKKEKSTKMVVARVMDITGKVVKTVSYGSAPAGLQKYNLDLGELATGQYSIQVITDTEIYMQKFVKK
ncbi:hypothetical protein DBR32_11020 [Taibaiella sp. KBW10]|uniref:T9SS type A sorting domain-containing protein n=1 Tax=Taibaiella sp. KBW10 TaxID=2153357 RepID=UPI000F5B4ABC|nr:T9SS type A sorting domain-containing protein [Taibaiella sp. KBW10]RQO30110.1 hypothetical protein DBR32_11020 [Taibaiella sp. KBW10]